VGCKLQCSVEKGKGIVPTEMDGCIVSGVDRSCPLVNVTPVLLEYGSVLWGGEHSPNLYL
jgi:hypothetical protein